MSDGSSNLISNSVQDATEEIFSTLKFPEWPIEFTLSKEETWEGIWIYRIYHPKDVMLGLVGKGARHKSISENEFNRIRLKMKALAEAFNGEDHLYARIKLNDVVQEWMFHFGDEVKRCLN